MNTPQQPGTGLARFRPTAADTKRLLLVALAYLAAHKLSYFVPLSGGVIAAIWPGSGIALAALLLSPRRLWPALLAVIAAVNFTVEMAAGRNLLMELGFLVANLIETGGSAWLITRWNQPPITFRRVPEVLSLLLAAFGVNAVSAGVGATAAVLGPDHSFWTFYRTWWVADGLGIVLVTPLIVSWLGVREAEILRPQWIKVGEAAGIFAVAAGLVWLYFGPRRDGLPILPSSYMLIIPLVWAALRLGPRGTCTVLALMGLAEVAVAALGLGSLPLGGAEPGERVLLAQLLVGTQCGLSLLLAASFAERRRSEESLRASEARLRTLGNNLPDCMIYQVVRERDGAMRFVHVSAGVERLNGLTPDEILRDPTALYGQLLEVDRAAVASAEEQSLCTMSRFDVVAQLRRRDGEIRWMHIRSQPRGLSDGRIVWEGIETDITDRRRMEESLRISEEKFSKAFRSSPVAVVITRARDGLWLESNAAAEHLLGFRREELLGRTTFELNIWTEVSDRERIVDGLSRTGAVQDLELRLRTRHGGEIFTQAAAELIEVGGERCILWVLADISARKRIEEELKRVNRALRTISNCNQVLVRAVDEPALLRALCQVIVADGGHRLVWVGYAEQDPDRTVRPVAWAGEPASYLEKLAISWADTEHGRGPTGTAIRTGKPVACHDFLTDPRMAPWLEAGRASGFRSSIALPLLAGDDVLGALTIYSADVQAFDEQEVRLLVELADDLAFGIRALRERHRKEDAERRVLNLLAEAEQSRSALLSILEDQKRGEEALRASEEQFRSAMEHSPIGMAIVSVAGRWLEVNQALCRIAGYTREEMLAIDFQSITHPDDLPKDLSVVQRLLSQSVDAYSVEKRYRHKLGHTVWIQLNATLLWNPDGTPRHFIAQIQDITARRSAEAERIRLVNDLGERVKELTALHRVARLLQQDRAFDHDLLSELAALLPAAWQYPEICTAQLTFAGSTASSAVWQDSPWVQEVEFRTRGGLSGAVRVAYREERPMADEGPFLKEERTLLRSLADMLAAHLDRVTAEAALRAVNRRYARHEAALSTLSRSYALRPEDLSAVLREIVEVVARTLEVDRVSLWTYNRPRTAIQCMDLFENSSQRHTAAGEIPRAGHEAYFNAVDSADVIAVPDILADPRTVTLAAHYAAPLDIVSLLDVPLHSRGNTTGVLCCEHRATPRQWTPDEQTFAVAVANLVSMLFAQLEQQQLEAQLRHAQKLEALGTLAGGIAHDFNNILGAIISFAELSRMDHPEDRELQENLGEVLKASNRAAALVRQILAFSRRQQPERKPIALAPVIREALQLMRSTLPATVEIRAELADHLPAVLADATQIHQVVMNLCTNAGHAMRGRTGRLLVTLEAVGPETGRPRSAGPVGQIEKLRLSVSDTGQGMDAATMERIFDPFFTTKGPGEGTGLGLAVVHGIVQEHGGRIEVESQLGVGTTFRIILPAAPLPASTVPPAGAAQPMGKGELILFVDDEAVLAESARRLLGGHGFLVMAVSHAEEAWAWIEREPDRFAAVLTDLTMPKMTGMDLALRIHRLRPNLPIFIMTGHAGEHTNESVRALGLQGLILKPINYPALAERLAGALASRQVST